MSRVRVFIASSLDGFIAGPGDDIAWLEAPRPSWAPLASGAWAEKAANGLTFNDFFADVGAILMGRRTFDVVTSMPGPWVYGDVPLLVATGRPLDSDLRTVSSASAPIANLIAEAKTLAGDKDVYLDGGTLVRQALDAGLIDQLVVTMHPTVLGAGHALFAGTEHRHHITVTDVRRYGNGMVQLFCEPAREPRDTSPVPMEGGPALDA